MTLVEMLEKNAKTKAENTAIIFHGNKLSYAELNEVVNKLAHASWRRLRSEG
jgi:non-ribosomal peptide synthetase component E (peptide arylation enzyme)